MFNNSVKATTILSFEVSNLISCPLPFVVPVVQRLAPAQTMKRVKYLVHALAIQLIPNSKPHTHTTMGDISMPRKETITLLNMNIGLVREVKKCCFLSSHFSLKVITFIKG